MMHCNQLLARYGQRVLRASLGWALAVLMVGAVHAQPQSFQEAKDAYAFAEYDKAIDLFSGVAQDTSVDKETRKEALRYLGRAYVAKDKRDKAREAIRSLLELEPPLTKLDPNREPPPIMKIYYEVRKQIEGGYGVEREGPGLQTLAIMDFTNGSVHERERYQSLSKGFPSMMINYMTGATDLKVIERERIQWILDELKLQQQSGVVDQSTAVRIGKLMGANAVLFGTFIMQEDEMWLSTRMVEVETSEILLAEKVMGEPEDFFELIEELSLKMTRAINVEMEETEMGTGSATRSLDAVLAYSDGLEELEDGNYRAAYEKFLEAQEHDPNYKQAQIKAESLKPMLAVSSPDTTGGSGDSGDTGDAPQP
jgi:TolB-like protein